MLLSSHSTPLSYQRSLRETFSVLPGTVCAVVVFTLLARLAAPALADTGTSLGDRTGEGSTPFTPLADTPSANLFSGSLGTRIPIMIPPGRKNMTPALALVYSSDGGVSPFGYGWSLPIGSIERSTKWGVPRCTGDHTEDFVLMLPGVSAELALNDTASPDVFRPKTEEAFVEAVAFRGAGNQLGKNRWEVRDRAGLKYTFGETPASRVHNGFDTFLDSSSCGFTTAWMLTKIEDPNGNWIEIKWTKTLNVAYPWKVSYGGNLAGIPHFYHVDFFYDTLPDRNGDESADALVTYMHGVKQQLTKQLASVTVRSDKTDDPTVREYLFTFSDPLAVGAEIATPPLLQGVTVEGYPDQYFSYVPHAAWHLGDPVVIDAPETATMLRDTDPSGEVRRTLMDMNGDGILDSVFAHGQILENGACADVRRRWDVAFGHVAPDGSFGFDSPVVWKMTPHGTSGCDIYQIRNVISSSHQSIVDTFDLTGDGIPDYIYASTPNWLVHEGGCLQPNADTGQCDEWGFKKAPTPWPAPFPHIRDISLEGGVPRTISDTIDMNGDALPDFVHAGDTSWGVYLNNGSGFASSSPPFPAPFPYLSIDSGDHRDYALIDFNGDGLPDIVSVDSAGREASCHIDYAPEGSTSLYYKCLYVFFNTGTKFETQPKTVLAPLAKPGVINAIGIAGLSVDNDASLRKVVMDIVDISGDGLPDFVTTDGPGSWAVALNTGGDLEPPDWASFPAAPNSEMSVPPRVWSDVPDLLRDDDTSGEIVRGVVDLVDLNGDGFLDHVRVDEASSEWTVRLGRYYLFNSPLTVSYPKPHLLSHMSNELGGKYSVRYLPSSRFDNTGGDGAPDLPLVKWVVTGTRLSDGLCSPPFLADVFDPAQNPCINFGHELIMTYSYANGRFTTELDASDVIHREFRGFGEIQSHDIDGNYTTTVFHQETEKKGRISTVEEYAVSQTATEPDDRLLRTQANIWVVQPAPDNPEANREQVFLGAKIERRFDTNGALAQELWTLRSVDQYGNVEETMRFGPSAVDLVISTTEYAAPDPTAAFRPYDRPVHAYTTDPDNDPPLLEEKYFFYDGGDLGEVQKGNLTRVESTLDTATSPATANYAYDSYGNLFWIVDSNLHSTIIDYDDGFGTYFAPRRTIEFDGIIQHQSYSVLDYRTGNTTLEWGPGGVPGPWGIPDNAVVHLFDDAGRSICEVLPGDTTADCTAEMTYNLSPGPGELGSVEATRKWDSSGANPRQSTTTYFDALGRHIRTEQLQMVGTAIETVVTSEVEYDPAGRVKLRYLPYAASGTAHENGFVAFSYELETDDENNRTGLLDPLGRVSRTTFSDSTFTRVVFNGAETVSYDEDDLKSVSLVDSFDRVIETGLYGNSGATSPYTTTNTEYDGLGRVRRVLQDGILLKVATYDTLGRETTLWDANSGASAGTTNSLWRRFYDPVGNMIALDDPKSGQHTQYCFDSLDRVTQKCFLSGPYSPAGRIDCAVQCPAGGVAYSYDNPADPHGFGRPWKTEDASGSLEIEEYDARGREVRSTRTVEAGGETAEATFSFTYNNANSISSIIYPGAAGSTPETVRVGFNSVGQPVQLESWESIYRRDVYVNAVEYDVFGRVTKLEHGNGYEGPGENLFYQGVQDTFAYNAARHRLSNLTVHATVNGIGHDWLKLAGITYNNRGQMTRVSDELHASSSSRTNEAVYLYDDYGRIAGYDIDGNLANILREYDYDSIGNIREKGRWSFSYDLAQRPHRVLTVEDTITGFVHSVDHDNNGNRTKSHDGLELYTYDHENRLTGITFTDGRDPISFIYDDSGTRRARVVDDGSPDGLITRYFSDLVTTTANGKTIRSYFLGSRLIATREVDGASWQFAAEPALFDGITVAAASIHGQPVLLVGVSPGSHGLVAGILALSAIGFLLAPGRRRTVVGICLRRRHAAGVAFLVLLETTGWPILLRPAEAQSAADIVQHYHTDHLGSVQVVTDEDGNLVEEIRYYPYGEVRGRFDAAGNPISADTAAFRREFTGHVAEISPGLVYAGARYYDPIMGTFLSQDPAGQFVNPYAYGPWDPMSGSDPTGAFWDTLVAVGSFLVEYGAYIGLVGGFFAGFGQTLANGGSLTDAFAAGLVGSLVGVVTGGIAGAIGAALPAPAQPVYGVSLAAAGLAGIGQQTASGQYIAAGVGAALFALGFFSRQVSQGANGGYGIADPKANPTRGEYVSDAALAGEITPAPNYASAGTWTRALVEDIASFGRGVLVGGPVGIVEGTINLATGIVNLDVAEVGLSIAEIATAPLRYGGHGGLRWGEGAFLGGGRSTSWLDALGYRSHDIGYSVRDYSGANSALLRVAWSRHDLGLYGQVHRILSSAVFGGHNALLGAIP